MNEACAFSGCSREPAITWMDLPICDREWERICSYPDWRKMPKPRLRDPYRWPDRSEPAGRQTDRGVGEDTEHQR